MESILAFGNRKPFLFVLILLAAWVLTVSAVAVLAGILFSASIADPQIQSLSTLIATILYLFGAYRAGWIDKIGIIKFGSLASWLVTFGVAIYVLLVNFYVFFGEISFQIGFLFAGIDNIIESFQFWLLYLFLKILQECF